MGLKQSKIRKLSNSEVKIVYDRMKIHPYYKHSINHFGEEEAYIQIKQWYKSKQKIKIYYKHNQDIWDSIKK